MSFFFTPIQAPFYAPPQAVMNPFAGFNPFGFGGHPYDGNHHRHHHAHRHGYRSNRCPQQQQQQQQFVPEAQQHVAEHRIEQLPDGTIILRPIYRKLTQNEQYQHCESAKKAQYEAAKKACRKETHGEAERQEYFRRIQEYVAQHKKEQEAYQDELKQEKAMQEVLSSLFGAFFGQNDAEREEREEKESVEKSSAPIVEEPSSSSSSATEEVSDDEDVDFFANPFSLLHNHPLARQWRSIRRKSRRCKQLNEQQQQQQQSEQQKQQNESSNFPKQEIQINNTTTHSLNNESPQTNSKVIKKVIQVPAGANIFDFILKALHEVHNDNDNDNDSNNAEIQSQTQQEVSTIESVDNNSKPITTTTTTAAVDAVGAVSATTLVEPAQPTEEEAPVDQDTVAVSAADITTDLTTVPAQEPAVEGAVNESSPQIKPGESVEVAHTDTDDINQNLLTKLFQQTEELYKKRTIVLNKLKNDDNKTNLTSLQSALKQIDRLIEQTHQYTQQLLNDEEQFE